MANQIHILATVRNPALLDAALLVFKSLRLGFPHNAVTVYGNGLRSDHAAAVQQAAASANAAFNWIRPTAHDVWLEHLVQSQDEPFWICDTDIVFFAPVKPPTAAGVDLAGRFEPGFDEEWTQCFHVERLHTCLLYLDPLALRAKMRAWLHQHVPSIFSHAGCQFIRQHFVAVLERDCAGGQSQHGDIPGRDQAAAAGLATQPRSTTHFYDTAAGLYHAFGGTAFDEEQNAAFEHLHCGSYSDLIGRCESLKDLPAVHQAVLANPDQARGLHAAQAQYYSTRGVEHV